MQHRLGGFFESPVRHNHIEPLHMLHDASHPSLPRIHHRLVLPRSRATHLQHSPTPDSKKEMQAASTLSREDGYKSEMPRSVSPTVPHYDHGRSIPVNAPPIKKHLDSWHFHSSNNSASKLSNRLSFRLSVCFNLPPAPLPHSLPASESLELNRVYYRPFTRYCTYTYMPCYIRTRTNGTIPTA